MVAESKIAYDITLDKGKYRLTYDTNMLPRAYRHGEPWSFDINMTGSGVILSMVQRIAALELSLAACKEFVRKCDAGEARSVRSYAEMTAAIAAAEE